MDSDILERLRRSNEAPSPMSISHVKLLLAGPSQSILEKKAEIYRLEKLVQDLKQDQDEIENFIQSYDTILAPIRCVPADVLREIFYHCLPTQRYPTMDVSEAPLLLTHVCKTWRSVLLSSPQMWAKIYIPLPLHHPSGWQHANDERIFEDISRARSKQVEIWLNRSGECPLSISIACPGGSLPSTYADDDFHPVKKILQNVASEAHRWRALELVVPRKMYRLMMASTYLDVLPSLTTFRLFVDTPGCGHISGADEFEWGSQAEPENLQVLSKFSNLKSLLISVNFNTSFRSIPPNILQQLSNLHLKSGIPENDLANLLVACPELVECKLHITGRNDHGNPTPQIGDDSLGYPKKTIHLPRLKKLVIYDAGSEVLTKLVYQTVDAPILNHVKYIRTSFNPEFFANPQRHPSVYYLLQISPKIDTVMLGYSGIHRPMIHECLRIARHTRHLILGHRLSSTSTNQIKNMQDCFDLNNLTLNQDSAHPDILLPCLQILEAHQIFTFSDEDLYKMIKSRLDASKNMQVAPLKSIKIWFTRSQERDIKEEVARYANGLGIDLKMELEYAERSPSYLDPLSPMYGLSEDDRTLGQRLEDTVPYPSVRI